MTSSVYVAGVGMIPFVKPGANAPYPVMGAEATGLALADAGVGYDMIQQAYVGYVYGDSTCGQRALYQVGMTGIPIINVNNNCSTGSTALFMARQAIESGALDCVLALGFEQMKPGALGAVFTDRPSAFDEFDAAADQLVDAPGVPLALRYFGGAGLSHMKKYGTPLSSFAKVRAKASRHARNNPLALFRKEVTADDVMNDQVIWPGVMTRLMACPPTCGAAAAVLVSEKFASKHGLNKKVRIAAQAMTTDTASTFNAGDMMKVVGFDMTQSAANKVYEAAGVGPEDIDVVELHDCFAHNELITYEALGLCPEGGAERFIDDGDNTYGGRFVTNPSGGLLSKGHPLGATGLAQCYELTRQLRGTADATQVDGARRGTAAQSRPRRRLRRHPLRTRLRPDMVDHSVVGRSLAPVTAHVEPGRLRFFRETLGETNPVYTRCRRRESRRLRRDAGAADLSVLPGNDGRRTGLRIPRPCSAPTSSSVLHGEQRFTYRAPVMVGDTLRFEPRIASITDKKGGAMTLAVVETKVTNQHGVHVADCSRTVVVLNKVAA